ncbi:hypothetical protein BC827DRAFT_1263734 [Russula dissimulans]|nr:hypothetical protein BC827DRAFT_1263734 [Russula dissimulans]
MPHKRAKQSVREQQKKERGADLAPPGGNDGISTERIPKSVARVLDAARIRAEYREKRTRLRVEEEANANDDVSTLKPPPTKKRRTDATAGTETLAAKGKGKGHSNCAIEIQPGESLKHFNRRVEDYMRPLVRSAMRASAATERKERNAASSNAASSNTSSTSTSNKPAKRTKTQPQQPSGQPPSSSSTTHKKSTTSRPDYGDRPKEFATTSSAVPRRLNDVVMAPPQLKSLPRGAAKHSLAPGGKIHVRAGGTGVLSMAQRAMMEVERENAIRRYREMKERKLNAGDRTLSRSEGHVDEG